jgi:hypothetical protein
MTVTGIKPKKDTGAKTRRPGTEKKRARLGCEQARIRPGSEQTRVAVDESVLRFAVVTATLENYARRGVFRGFSEAARSKSAVEYRLRWHHDQVFELIFDVAKNTLRFPRLLPSVVSGSEMPKELQRFVESRHSDEVVEHRRIDKSKAQARVQNHKGSVALSVRIKDGDDEYATRKLIHLAHEIFLVFLMDGCYYDYLVENFDLDPDHI